jgi:hypothetical protein
LNNAYIKFPSREDAVAGVTELVAHCDLACLSNEIFCVPRDSLRRLDALLVKYSFASEEDLAKAQPIWNLTGSPGR